MQLRFDLSFTIDTETDIKIAKVLECLLCDLVEDGLMINQTITPVRGGKGEVVQRNPERFKHFAPDVPVTLDPNHSPEVPITLSNGCTVEPTASCPIDPWEAYYRDREIRAESLERNRLYEERRSESLQGMTTVPHGL